MPINAHLLSCVLFSISFLLSSALEVTLQTNVGCAENVNQSCQHGGPSGGNDLFFNNLIAGEYIENGATGLNVLWSTMFSPTFLISNDPHGEGNASFPAAVDWGKLINGTDKTDSVELFDDENEAGYVFGVVIPNLFEFNSTEEDISALLNPDGMKNYDLSDPRVVKWNAPDIKKEDGLVTASITSNFFISGGNITIVLSAFTSNERASSLPALLHTNSSFQIDLQITGVTPALENSMMGLDILPFATKKHNSLKKTQTSYLDDEFTPGIFHAYQIVSEQATDSNRAYLTWKPVAYTDHSPTVENTEVISTTNLYNNNTFDNFPSSIAKFIKNAPQILDYSSAMKISLGDGSVTPYGKSKFVSFTALIGFGSAPVDSISGLVIFVIIIGCAVPIGLLVVVSAFVTVWRVKRSRQLQEDEINIIDHDGPDV